jgi:LuxR family maltose regulon positive regulatory protein
MPEKAVRARPRLCLARGWTLQMGPTLDLDGAEDWAQLALQTAAANGALDSDLSGEAAALQAMVAATRGEMGRSRELGIQAERDLPHDSPWRSAVVFCLGTAHMDVGDMAAAAHAFDEAIRLSGATGADYVQLAAGSFLADIQVYRGHLGRAMELYQQVLAWADPNLPQKGSVMAQAGLASILYERNQLDDALDHVRLGADQVDQVGGAWAAHVLNTVLARVHQARGNATDALAALDRSYQIGQKGQVSLVATQAAALIARLQLAQSDRAAAEAWAADSGLSPDGPQASHAGLREVEYLTLARVLDAQGRHGEALSLLQRLLQSAQVEGRTGSVITILALQALSVQTQGDTAAALALLERALTLAEPEGYVRVFVDEGAPMRVLLNAFQALLEKRLANRTDDASRRLLAYTGRLLAAFSWQPLGSSQGPATLPEPLTERELEILKLISQGLSNKEIADSLVIAVSTVKSHINTLYAKLGTHRRTEAVAIARDLGLL